jgi:heptaprenyl diphosphate synthase
MPSPTKPSSPSSEPTPSSLSSGTPDSKYRQRSGKKKREPQAIVKTPRKSAGGVTGVMSETMGREPQVIVKMPRRGTGCVTGRCVTGAGRRNLALLAGLSIALYTVENLIPLPIPWLRIGVGNIGVLLALYMLSPLDGFFVLLIKIVIGSLFSGRFLSPFFLFALGAGIPSYWIMVGVKLLTKRRLGLIGVSVSGAVSHNLFQLGIAYLIVIQNVKVFYLAPVLVVLGTVSGVIIGAAVRSILPHLGIDTKAQTSKIER